MMNGFPSQIVDPVGTEVESDPDESFPEGETARMTGLEEV